MWKSVKKAKMRKIQVLPEHIANKIAAGEVVDRPASVVKELVENALDAQADEIAIIISKAGKELIQVIDNGVGISEEDLPVAFERHATSKITNAADLDELRTLGFRGEALPSIASVSRVEVKTCERGQEVGTRLLINGGNREVLEKIAFKPGTTISVKNLFFNTPARRNFLRSDVTEFSHILKTAKRFFLSYPDVKFTLIHNGETLFDLPKGSIDERITAVFGEEFYDSLVLVREDMGDITLEGYVCRPDKARGTSDNQYIFLNRRVIVNRALAHAIFQGYGNLIYHLFLNAVRRGVQTREGATLISFPGGEPMARKKEIRQHFETLPRMNVTTKPKAASKPGESRLRIQNVPKPEQTQIDFEPLVPNPNRERPMVENAMEESEQAAPPRLWQVHNRYIFSQIKSGLVIIDQQAAHQRILYERTLNYLLRNEKLPSQQLLFPQTVTLSLEDYLIFEEIREWLRQVGFVINELSGRTIVLEAIPADVKVGHESRILLEIIDHYREHKGEKISPAEKMAQAFAVKNAIRAGDKLTPQAMNDLVDQLFATKEPYYGPMGKPVIITLELDELERRFKK